MKYKRLSMVICIVLLSDCKEHNISNGSTDLQSLPVVSVALGMPIHQVETESSLQVQFFNSVSQTPADDFHTTVPHQLNYVHPTLGFILPNMEQIAIDSFRGNVTSISDRPMGRILTIDDAIGLCKVYMKIIDNAGWQRVTAHTGNLYSFSPTRNFKSLEEVKSAFLDRSLSEPLEKVKISSWRNGKDEVEMTLKRISGSSVLPAILSTEREYSLTVELSNFE